ncbi:lysozyme inhibitor LprI family protein [Psychrobacter alimentarius]|uniref:lysozyme inhibitor LprI family protein n=1 Tax=Psychrobacter alimentarius TaxID=261164 RepID=UPI001919FA37|nr:lysozyme inhibitor LprI family protein [Psychrobacter alimentarius]
MKLMTNASMVAGTVALLLFTAISAQAAFVENEYICEDIYMEKAYDCANNAVIVEKNRLNNIYNRAYRRLNKAQRQQLDTEQLAWLKARNDKCYFEHDGPMNNTIVYAQIGANVCTATETQKRSKAIAKRYNIQ